MMENSIEVAHGVDEERERERESRYIRGRSDSPMHFKINSENGCLFDQYQ